MQVDFLIVGQGICGTMLSWYLHKEGKTFLVIDEEKPNSSSRVAAGVINPVTGRRYAYSWMIEDLIPFAAGAYRELEQYLEQRLLYARNIIDFFPSPDARLRFMEKMTENDTYLNTYPDQNHFNQFFHFEFGCGEISPAFTVHLPLLLAAWRNRLIEWDALSTNAFAPEEVRILDDGIQYGNVTAQKIIFCEGTAAVSNPWFNMLPFSLNKGEALIIESEELTQEHIFKKGMLLVPLPQPHYFWVGSNYQWEFEDEGPQLKFLEQTTTLLKNWIRKPFRVVEHKAAVRPATLERRPFVGWHPLYPQVGILNGMGTKGTSLAPFFAHQLVQQIIHQFPLTPDADVHRFSRILSK